MNERARQTLCELVATYGRALGGDARRCEGLLRDFCGEARREIFVLIAALKEGVPADLAAAPGAVPPAVLRAQLARRLHENLALTEEAARWAVESWTLALGTAQPQDLKEGGALEVASEMTPSRQTEQPTTRRTRGAAIGWIAGAALLWAAVGTSAGALAAGIAGLSDQRASWMTIGALGGMAAGLSAGALARAMGGAIGEAVEWAVSGTVGGGAVGAVAGTVAGGLVGSAVDGSWVAGERAFTWAIYGATAGAMLTAIFGAASGRAIGRQAGQPAGHSGAEPAAPSDG